MQQIKFSLTANKCCLSELGQHVLNTETISALQMVQTETLQSCVTNSSPIWGFRSYGTDVAHEELFSKELSLNENGLKKG